MLSWIISQPTSLQSVKTRNTPLPYLCHENDSVGSNLAKTGGFFQLVAVLNASLQKEKEECGHIWSKK